MQSLYDVPAPAKINLFLHIVGRRPDGYHRIESAFLLLDWCDTLHFSLRPDGGLSREDLSTPLPADDLVLRAARALQQASGCSLGAHIGLHKSIPAQAGLGGGSSDAASTLLALNRLWGLGWGVQALSRLALALGADVPFFVEGRNAWVQGVGEQITPIQVAPTGVVVVKPPQGLATAAIFADPGLQRDCEPAIISGFVADPFGFGRNVLQDVAQGLCPGVSLAIRWLASLGLSARMTGSGSAVFAPIPQGADARWKVRLMQAPAGFEVRLCSSLEAHPLRGWATGPDFSVGSLGGPPA